MFLEFSNLFLNDLIYLLDETLTKLEELKKYEDKGNNLSEEEKAKMK